MLKIRYLSLKQGLYQKTIFFIESYGYLILGVAWAFFSRALEAIWGSFWAPCPQKQYTNTHLVDVCPFVKRT